MFRNPLFFSLLASNLYISSATVSGTTVTITDSADFTNQNTISLIVDNKATTLKLSGSLTEMPKFKGYTLVKNVVIEATGITEIPEKCFYQNSHIDTVTMHSGITAIRNYAFTYSSIRSINLENIESIGHYAFQKCPNLKTVNLQKISYIGVGPFYESGIETLSISIGVHFIIQRGSFQNCFFLKSVSFANTASNTEAPRSVQILDYAFMNCHQLKTITTSNLLINAYDYTFANTALETFPFESLSTVGSYTFLNTKLKAVAPTSATTSFVGSRMTFRFCFYIQTVDLSNVDGNYTNSYGMFYRCSGLTTVKLPASMTILPDSMFKDCQALKSIIAPGLTEISTDGLMSCTSLETIDIGSSSITKIGYRGIHNCPKLNITIQNVHLDERAIYANDVIESMSVSYLSYWSCMNMTNLKSVNIRSNQYEIPVGYFMYCTKLETVNIPNTATYIGDLCFAFTNLKNTLDLNRVYRLRDYAFWRSNLTGIRINTDMGRFGTQCFYECPNLVTITFTSRVQKAMMSPFFGNNQKFEFVSQSSYVTWDSTNKILRNNNVVIYVAPDATISDDFFQTNDFEIGSLYWYKQLSNINCITSHNYNFANSSITSITFTDDPSVSNYILQDMSYSTELTTVQLSPGITEISSGCFKGCSKLKTINLGDIKKIGEGAFIGCTSLDNIDISKVTHIMPEAFKDCVSLEKVNFPASLVDGRNSNNEIGMNFFANTGFTEITFATAIQQTSYFQGMFVGCKKLNKVTLGPGVSKVPDHICSKTLL